MADRPILFSAPMVRSILAGTKTQTRRAMKHQPGPHATVTVEEFNPTIIDRHGDAQPGPEVFGAWWDDGEHALACPYGQPGDRLWVRETWRETSEGRAWHYAADGTVLPKQRDKELQAFLAHRAPFTWESYKWRPSIHMPRAASRITLEVTGVRVERLQDIREADALAEGIVRLPDGGFGLPAGEHYHHTDPRLSYLGLWEAINGDGSVEANPWVWVVEFRRLP